MITLLGVLFALLAIFLIKRTADGDEGWYPTTTYVNTPTETAVYPTDSNNWWGGNYYYRLNWQPWGYHHPGYYYQRGPIADAIKSPYVNYTALPYSNLYQSATLNGNDDVLPLGYLSAPQLADASPFPNAPIPGGNPVPVDTIRWNGLFGPMLTSIRSPKEYALGQWVTAGTAYTDNPNDFTYLTVQQLNLDPGRDLFSYRVLTKDGQIIPINLRPNHNRLEDGDRFKVQGMEGKGDFVFTEADKYTYVYS